MPNIKYSGPDSGKCYRKSETGQGATEAEGGDKVVRTGLCKAVACGRRGGVIGVLDEVRASCVRSWERCSRKREGEEQREALCARSRDCGRV